MTTATHTQGLLSMYPTAQQYAGQLPFSPQYQQFGYQPQYQQFGYQQPYQQAGMMPQFGPQQYGPQQQYGMPQQYGQAQYGQLGHQSTQSHLPIQSQAIQQQIAAELFRLAQLVQQSSQLVGPQPGKPTRPLIAAELFRLAQQVQQSGHQHQQQFATPYGMAGQQPIWS